MQRISQKKFDCRVTIEFPYIAKDVNVCGNLFRLLMEICSFSKLLIKILHELHWLDVYVV